MATTTSPPQPTSSASSPLVQTTTATLGTSSPVAAATVPAGELTENIQYMKLLHELKAEFPAVPDELVKSCITQHGKDRDRCVELLSAESDRITQGQGLKGRFSLQGRRRNSLTTLCPSSNGGVTQTTKNSAPPNCASELAASNCYYENLKNIRQRRNSSYVPMISDKSRSSFSHTPSSKNGVGVPGDEINLDDESVTNIIPMVVLTPESPPRELLSGDKDEKLKKWDLYEYGKKPVQTLFKPVSNSTVNSVKHHSSQGNGKRKRDLLILGRTSSVTATTLDLERIANDNDDILNNNSSGDSVAKRDLDETGSNSSASSVCSLSTTTLSQGELSLLHCNDQDQIVPLATTAFTTIRCKSISVNPGLKSDDPNKVTRSTTSSTVFTLPKMSSPRIVTSGMANGHGSSNLCPENPFRKVFARRKEFYQTIGSRQENYSSVNRLLWRKRHCTLCCAENRKCEMPPNVAAAKKEASPPPSIITLNANIEPFAPFTIKHDVESVDDSELRLEECEPANNSSGEILKTLGPSDGLEFSPDGKELRYATSTINSEEGVESHLEVSLAKNGTSMITTRTKRVGSPSEIANNSLLQVQTDESGRKIFSIQQTCQKRQLTQPRQPRPSSLNLNNSPPFFLANDLVGMGEQLITTDNGGRAPYPPFLSNSAYCTQMTSSSQMCKDTEYVPGPRYNSLPNLFGRVPIMSVDPAAGGNHNPVVPPGLDWVGGPGSISSGSKNWLYNAHPEDEKKRIAYTRALLSHQMEQRLKLEHELRLEKDRLGHIKHNIFELKEKVDQKEMLRLGPFGHRDIGKTSVVLERDILELRKSCDKMAEEVTKLTKGTVPLCETSIEFYESLNTFANDEQPSSTATGIGSSSSHTQTTPVNNHVAGTTNVSKQSVNVVNNLNQNTTTTVSTSRIVGGEQGGHGNNGSALAEGPQWSCSECTFLNHPALDQCEQCEWFRTGGSSRSSSDKSSTGSDSSSSSRVSYSSSSNPSNRRHPFPSSQPRASCFCHPNTPTPSSPPPAGGGGDRVGGGRPPPPLSSTNTSGSSTNSSILAHLWEMTSATSDGSSTAAQPPSRLQTPR